MTPIAHIISKQSGSAYPLEEFAKILARDGWQVKIFAYAQSEPIFSSFGWTCNKISSYQDYSAKVNSKPSLILTGTSIELSDDEQFWHFARTNHIVSAAWVDQPVNLSARFSGRPSHMPSLILANDRETAAELEAMQLHSPVKCWGSPYLSSLQARFKRDVEPFTAYFATEPTTPDDQSIEEREYSEHRSIHGFDDLDSYLVTDRLVNDLRLFTGDQWQLKVKLHPRDSAARFSGSLKRYFDYHKEVCYTDLSKEVTLEKANVVFGMRSTLLYQSAMLGVPTISIQPNRKTKSLMTDNRPNLLVVTDEKINVQFIYDFLQTPPVLMSHDFSDPEFKAFANMAKQSVRLEFKGQYT